MALRKILAWFQRHFALRNLRWWQWLLLVLVGVWFTVRLWLPGFIRQQVVANLTAITTAQVTLGDVDLNLLRGRLALQQLSFTLANEERPILAIRDLAVNLRLRSLLRRAIAIEDISVKGMQIEGVQEPNGQWNLTRLFPPSPPEQEQAEPTDLPTLTVRRFQIVDSLITYRDRTRQAEPHFALHIRDLTTDTIDLHPHGLVTPVVTRIDGTLDQSPLHGDARVLWQRERMDGEATIEAQSLPLTMIEPYLQEALVFQKLAGQLEVALHYRYRDGGTESPVHALNGTVTAVDLQVADTLSQQTMLEVPGARAEIETVDLLQHDIRISAVELRNPKVVLLQTPTGVNLASLIRSTEPPTILHGQPASTSPWRFTLQTVNSTGGEVTYRDSRWPEAETFKLSPQTLEISQLGSEAGESPFRLQTRLGEGTVTGEGMVRFSPFTLQGQFQPKGVDVTTLRPFLAAALPGKTLQGTVTGTVQTEFAQQEGNPVLRLAGTLETAKFHIDGLPETGNSVGWESGQVEIAAGSTVLPLTLQFKPQLSRLLFHRPTPGDLTVENLQGHLRLAQSIGAEGSQPLTLSGTVETAQLTLNGVPESTSVLAWENGQLEIRDGSTLTPLVLEVSTQLSKISLQQFSQGDMAIEKANGTLRLGQEESPQQEQILRAQGPVEMTGFVLTQGLEKQILLGCYHATATIAEGSRLLPFAVRLRDVALEYTYGQGVRTASGQFQLFIPPAVQEVTTLPEAEASPPLAASPITSEAEVSPATLATETAEGPTLYIDQVSMIGGELYFEDRAVTPTQTIYWQDVRVNLRTVGYPLAVPAVFSAHAYNEEGAPVEFKGATEKQGEQTVIRVRGRVQKMSLSRFNAYLGPSLGYQVSKGMATVTWDLVLPSERFQADMQVTLHNLTLGGKDNVSELEQQVGLPLALVIALLKDLNGDINLRLPVEGRLNEPGFRLEGAILRAVRDVLIGAVVSPLKLLGAIFTGKEELTDFTFLPLQFLPGTSQMTEGAKKQLERVSQFLAQRPALDLRLSGLVSSEDVQLLKDQAILTQLTRETAPASEQAESVVETPGAPPVQLTPQEEVRRFLTQQLHPIDGVSLPSLSESATTLLVQLRQKMVIAPEVTERLIAERVQNVTTELTAQHAIAATRLHVRQEKQRGAGAAEVRYVIQTREGVTTEVSNTSAQEPPEKRKRERR